MKEYIIIGSGIAGLYTAYNLLKRNISNFIILERNDRVGGRIYTETFAGKKVVAGAGIGRYDKDILLKKLLKELSIETLEPQTTIREWINIPPKPKEIKNFIRNILSTIDTSQKGSFEEVVTKQFGRDCVTQFAQYVGYTDFLHEDVRETIFHYGMEDNFEPFRTFHIDWDVLLSKLLEKIGSKRIYLRTEVVRLKKNYDDTFTIICRGKKTIKCRRVIFATDISLIHKVFPKNPLFSYIASQPFSRLYVQFSENSSKIIKRCINKYTIVPSLFQKIIPITPEEGIYMIAYNDNKNALALRDFSVREILDAIQFSLGINETLDIIQSRLFFWEVGTHYYRPYYWEMDEWDKIMFEIQHPKNNVYTVGEAFSFNQGWTEGALESVENLSIF